MYVCIVLQAYPIVPYKGTGPSQYQVLCIYTTLTHLYTSYTHHTHHNVHTYIIYVSMYKTTDIILFFYQKSKSKKKGLGGGEYKTATG